MGFFTKDIQTMEDLLLHGLQDIYYAEQQITKALPTMIEQATNRDLAQRPESASGRDPQADRAAGPGVQEARP